MQMLNHLHKNKLNKSNKNSIKRSHILIFGSLLVFLGFISLTFNYFITMRDQVYNDMKIAMMDISENNENVIAEDVQVAEQVNNNDNNTKKNDVPAPPRQIDWSRYTGVLEIPKIGLKRGFYNTDSRYNSINYNVTMVKGSNLPNVHNGNLILMAHSGDAYISYFAYLYKLKVGDYAFVTYNGVKYKYQIKKIYYVPKTGVVNIYRNENATCLTMITCTKDSDTSQTIYISELV